MGKCEETGGKNGRQRGWMSDKEIIFTRMKGKQVILHDIDAASYFITRLPFSTCTVQSMKHTRC